MRRCEAVALTLACALLFAAAPARADHAAASARFEAGRRLARENRWTEAAAEFKASLQLEPSVGGHLNLGNAYEKLGKLASAAEEFERAERLAGASDTERANEARSRREAVASKIPTILVKVAPGSTIAVDDRPVVGGASVPVDPGSHVVSVTSRAGKTRRIDVDVKISDHAQIMLTADDDRPQISLRGGPNDTTQGGDDGSTLRTLGWVGIGVGVASLVASGVFYGLAVSDKSSLESTCPAYPRCRAEEIGRARDLDDSAHSKSTVATITLVTGTLFAATGAVLLLVAPRASHGESTSTPQASFGVAPARSGVGASAVLRF